MIPLYRETNKGHRAKSRSSRVRRKHVIPFKVHIFTYTAKMTLRCMKKTIT